MATDCNKATLPCIFVMSVLTDSINNRFNITKIDTAFVDGAQFSSVTGSETPRSAKLIVRIATVIMITFNKCNNRTLLEVSHFQIYAVFFRYSLYPFGT